MAVTSAAVLNGLASSFLNDGKKAANALVDLVLGSRLLSPLYRSRNLAFLPLKVAVTSSTPNGSTARYPGGKFFDPLIKDGVYIPDTEKLRRLKVAEIKHARIAMLAVLIFHFDDAQAKTPLGALGL